MIPVTKLPERFVALIRAQQGAVTRDQARGFGVSDAVIGRLVRDGTWRRLARGVYATGPDTWDQRVWAGLLIGGPRAVIGGRAAARLWHVPLDAPRRHHTEPPIDVYVGQGHNTLPALEMWRFIRGDRDSTGTPRRTTLAQTIVDLAQTMTADELASLLGHRECRQQVTPEQILRALGTTPRHKNRALLIDIVSDASQGVRSALERRYLHDVERAHGLPTAQRQATPVGIYMVDNLYEDQDVIVELDSQAYHRGPAAGRDFERDRVHERNGFVTLRYTWKDVVDRPCRTADEIATTLAGRGWTGHLTRCPRCRAAHV